MTKIIQHSPKPWEAPEDTWCDFNPEPIGDEGHDYHVWIRDAEENVICSSSGDDLETVKANAYLIASSPDLLDACESALDFIRSMKDCIPDWADQMKCSEGEGYTHKLAFAITKATKGKDQP